jgi:hypothetical protein
MNIENVEFCDEDGYTKIKKGIYLHSFEIDDNLMIQMYEDYDYRTTVLVTLTLIITREKNYTPYALDLEFFVDILNAKINRKKFEDNYSTIFEKMCLAVEDSVKTGFLKNVVMISKIVANDVLGDRNDYDTKY